MKSYKGYIFDMDGVLYRGDEIIYDAVEAINKLKEMGRKVIFITNNSTKLDEEYRAKLLSISISSIDGKDILTSGDVAAEYLQKELKAFPNRRNVLCVAGNAVRSLMTGIGMEIIDPKDYKKAHYVVMGMNKEFNWEIGNYSANAVAVYGAKLIATNPDIAKPAENGEICAGTGAIVAFIETASRSKAIVMGKPYPEMYNIALQRIGLEVKDALMVGDLLETDIKGAVNIGMDSALVLTGMDKQEDIDGLGIEPTYVLESLKELLV